jgi:Fic family protein
VKLNNRQQAIIDFARTKKSFQTKDVLEAVGKEFGVERLTIVRDLTKLEKENILEKSGAGRSVRYSLTKKYRITETIPVEDYFAVRFQSRDLIPFFNPDVFRILSEGVFLPEEIRYLTKENQKYIKKRETLTKESPAILRREWERLIIELSWKSSEIEGNTYTLLETEALIKENEFAKGKDKAEAQMILNHKEALDFILQNPEYFSVYNEQKVKKMHELLVQEIDIRADFRNHPVGIGGTLYRPLGKEKDIAKAMKELTELVSKQKNPFEKAFLSLIMLSYIQAFEDGNKRTARIVSNALLYANNCAMLSYRDVRVSEYKKAALLFYEQNNVNYFKQIFMEQFIFAVKNYFQ